MLTLERLQAIRLHRVPFGQIAVAELGLRLDYRFPRRTEIVLEGVANLPSHRSVFLAMNHTDRYNYWPFQYAMYRHGGLPFTATWVKGKYYEQPLVALFLDSMNNIPLPSRGYVITTEFRRLCHRVPNPEEYRVLRDILNGEAEETEVERAGLKSPAMARVLAEAGRGSGTFRERLEALFLRMMDEVVRITRDAIDLLKLNVLVFPQGTRSIRLSRGHIGLAQMAQSLGAPIVPVGCNGSDRLYPSGSPFSRGGRVVYRIGRPLLPDGPELGPHRITVPFAPFRREVEEQYGGQLRAITDVVMDRINELLDEPYQFSEDRESEGVRGMNRFL